MLIRKTHRTGTKAAPIGLYSMLDYTSNCEWIIHPATMGAYNMVAAKTIAIWVAVLVCGAGIVYFAEIDYGDVDNGDGNSSNSNFIRIVDGSGATITLSEPLTSVVTVNTNVPKAMKVLGLADELKGLCFYTTSSDTDSKNYAEYKGMFTDPVHLPTAQSLTGEAVIAITGCKYVIAPVSSMTLSSTQETQFNQLGITIIRLDCFGDTALEDLEKLTILFGGNKNPKMMGAYNSYLKMYNDTVNAVKATVAASGKSNETFLYYFGTAVNGGSFYNQTSGGSMMIEEIYGKNALRNVLTSSNLISPTNPASATGIKEVVIQEDQRNGINKIFIRGSSSTSAGDGTAMARGALGIWKNISISEYGLSAVGNNEVYVFNTNIMSGMLSFAGWVAIAEVCGINTGLHIADLITAYNNAYGFNEPTNGYVFKMTGGNTGSIGFTELTI